MGRAREELDGVEVTRWHLVYLYHNRMKMVWPCFEDRVDPRFRVKCRMEERKRGKPEFQIRGTVVLKGQTHTHGD